MRSVFTVADVAVLRRSLGKNVARFDRDVAPKLLDSSIPYDTEKAKWRLFVDLWERSKPGGRSNPHISHCCFRHGCEYGDKDCPVAAGKRPQRHLCERCEDDLREEIVAYRSSPAAAVAYADSVVKKDAVGNDVILLPSGDEVQLGHSGPCADDLRLLVLAAFTEGRTSYVYQKDRDYSVLDELGLQA